MQKSKFLAALLSAAMVVTSAAVPVLAYEVEPISVEDIDLASAADVEGSTEDGYVNGEDSDNGGYTVVDENGNPPDVDDTWENVIQDLEEAPEGYKEVDDSNVEISSAKGLAWFAKQVTDGNNYENTTVKLTQAIDLSDHLWMSIGGVYDTDDNRREGDYIPFKGIFDGQNHEISGFFVFKGSVRLDPWRTYSYRPEALFALNEGTIQNVTISGTERYATAWSSVGVIACYNAGTIKDCKSSVNITILETATAAGGIVGGNQDNGQIINCEYTGKIYYASGVSGAGGIAGISGDNCKIESCVNRGNIETFGTGSTVTSRVGGIVGKAGLTTISDCTNDGWIDVNAACVGGIAGQCRSPIESCTNNGDIVISGRAHPTGGLGGIVGVGNVAKDCTNNGDIDSGDSNITYVGGIMGDASDPGVSGTGVAAVDTEISGCTNNGNVSSNRAAGHVGGIVGKQTSRSSDQDTLSGNTNTGSVSSTGRSANVGGIAGSTNAAPDNFKDNNYIGGEDESAIGNYTGTLPDGQTKEDLESQGSEKVIADLKDTAGNLTVEIDKNSMKEFFSKDLAKNADVGAYSVTVDPIVTPEEELDRDKMQYDGIDKDENSKLQYVDIHVCRNGQPIDVETDNEISVTFTIGEPIEKDSNVYIYHYADSEWSLIDGIEPTKGAVTFTTNSFSPFAYTFNPSKTAIDNPATKINVSLEKVAGLQNVYDIILNADSGNLINGFMSAEFDFDLADAEGIGYNIIGGAHMNVIRKSDDPNHYEINMDGVNDEYYTTNSEIKIGQVVFSGYGTGKFKITGGVVHTEKIADNIVDTFEYNGGEGNLSIDDDLAKTGKDINISVETKTVTVNVMFPNKLADLPVDMTDMTVTAKGGTMDGETAYTAEKKLSDKDVTLVDFDYTKKAPVTEGVEGMTANANGYKLTFDVPVPAGTGNRVTFTFSGLGYRTYSVDALIESDDVDPTVTVWNNVMDTPTAVVNTDPDRVTVKTFLAGDIVEDNTINLYDLSAVVAYFGKTNTVDPAEAYKNYIQYDLNRDGQIDSKDIAMVLVSWKQ